MSKLNKFIVDKNGQWAHPGKLTAVPTKDGRITMEGVPYPVMGFVPGQPPIMMQPGGRYQFPGKMVYEIPMVRYGGDPSIPDLSNKGWLSKYQKGGRRPIVLPDDDYGKMRLEAYRDSSMLNMEGLSNAMWFENLVRENNLDTDFITSYPPWDRGLNKIKPTAQVNLGDRGGRSNFRDNTSFRYYQDINGNNVEINEDSKLVKQLDKGYNVYKAPVQPIKLGPRFSKIEMNGAGTAPLDYNVLPTKLPVLDPNAGYLTTNFGDQNVGERVTGRFNTKDNTWSQSIVDKDGNVVKIIHSDGTTTYPDRDVIEQTPEVKSSGRGMIQMPTFQDGGIKSFGSRVQYTDTNGEYKIRRTGDADWKVLDKDQTSMFKNALDLLSGKNKTAPTGFVDNMFSDMLGPYKKPAKPKEKKPEPKAVTNSVSKPVIAEALPTFASAITGVQYPEVKEQRLNKEATKYSVDPEFINVPYKDSETAITEYQKTPNYALRYKNVSDYAPDDIIKVQSYLDNNGYFSERKKQINIDEYKTPEQALELQKYLANEGLLEVLGVTGDNIDGNLSGKIDKKTLEAVRQYNMYNQKYNSGQLDNNTRDAINEYKNKIDAKSPLGISVKSPFELYDPQTGEPNVDLTYQSMQEFEQELMKRGYFTGNQKYDFNLKPSEIKIGYNFRINPNQDYSLKDDARVNGNIVEGCAQYVNGMVCGEDVVGENAREELGFKGDAWTLSENIQNKGGRLVFSGIPERTGVPLSPKATETEVSNYLKTTLNTDATKGQLREMLKNGQIKPGDVVNIFYEGSPSTKKAWNQTQPGSNRFFTTHVGIVKADDDGKLYIEHNVHKDLQKQPIEDFIEGKVMGNSRNKVSLIAGITRPNYFDGVENDGRVPAAGVSYYQTEYGQFNPKGALASKTDYAGKSVSGESTYKFLSVIEKNKDAVLKDIPITENEFGKLMRVARVIPTLETYAKTDAKTLNERNVTGNLYVEVDALKAGEALGLRDEVSMGFTRLKDEANLNENLRQKLYNNDDYQLNDPTKAALPTFYTLSKNYLYLKEVANEYELNMTSDQLAKLAGLSYNQSIGKVAAELIQKGGYDNYIKYRRETATEGDGKFKYHGAIDMYDKQTMRYGGWLRKYQGDNGPSQVKPTSNFTLPSLDPQAQQSADYNKGWEDYNAGVRTWTELLQEKEEKKGRTLTTDEKQRWLQKAVKRNDGRKTAVDPNDPKWNFLFKESYQTWDPEFGPMTVMSKPVDVTYQMTDLDKEKARIATETRKAEMTPFAKSLGMKETDPNVQKRASQNANDQVALRILNDKPQGDRNRVDWLNTLTPEERSTIERSQYAGKLEPDYTSQFSQGVENIARRYTIPGQLFSNGPLWTNPDYTPEEAATASPMGVLAPLSYPTNLVTGAITGDFGSALQGQRSKPLFTDYRQPEFAATMSGLGEAIYDPMNAVGIGLLEGTNIAGNAARTGRYLNNKYLDIAEGANPFDYAWRSPAARFDNAAIESGIKGDLMPTSQKHFEDISSRLNLTDEERKILKEYSLDSGAFTGRGFETIDKNKRAVLDDILKRAEIETSDPLVMSRRVDASNPELFKRVGNKIVFDRPTSWSAGRDALGNNVRAERSPDRIVTKLPSGKNKVLKNPYETLTDAQLEEYKQSLRAKGYSEDLLDQYTEMFNVDRVSERELLLGANSEFKQIGKVKNKIGGYDYIVKPMDTPTQLPGSANKFKSEIDWGKWNSEIPSNKALMDEYNTIEQTTKANGSWMKNPDGSPFQGTPEQFVQQNSQNFKRAFGDIPNIAYRGQTRPTETIGGGNRGYAEGISYLGDKDQALTYAETWKHPKHSGKIYQPGLSDPNAPALYELMYPNSTNKKIITHSEPRSWQKLTDDDVASQMNQTELEMRGKSYKGEQFINTDDVGNFVAKNNLDYAYIPNIMDYARDPSRKFFNLLPGKNVGNTLVMNSKPGNYLKSRWYNNGMFDMTNPNIYKALVPAAIGTGAAAVIAGQDTPQQKYGGWLNKYQPGGFRPYDGGYRKPITINDTRKVNATSGQPINPNVDLKSGDYNSKTIDDVVKASKYYNVDPYTALAIGLQETNLGKSDPNIGHVLDGNYADQYILSNPESTVRGFQFNTRQNDVVNPDVQLMVSTFKNKLDRAKKNNVVDPLLQIQYYNGLGFVYPQTEKDYHKFEMQSIYGVPLTSKGISMMDNPLYGKRILDLKDNVLMADPKFKAYVQSIYDSYIPQTIDRDAITPYLR